MTHQLQKQNHRLTGGSTVHTINIEIRATGAVSPEIPTSVFVISLQLVDSTGEHNNEVSAHRAAQNEPASLVTMFRKWEALPFNGVVWTSRI